MNTAQIRRLSAAIGEKTASRLVQRARSYRTCLLRREYASKAAGLTDTWTLMVEGGRGGDGCVSFARSSGSGLRGGSLRNIGRPSGGDGGRGGDVWIEACARIGDLKSVAAPKIIGKRGNAGRGDMVRGRDGEPTIIRVPVGTIVREIAQPAKEINSDNQSTHEPSEHHPTLHDSAAADADAAEAEHVAQFYVCYPGWEDRGEIFEWERRANREPQGRRLLEQIGRLSKRHISRASQFHDTSAEAPLDCDLTAPGQRVLVAAGGQGGHGNRWFAMRDRPPAKFASRGLAGGQRQLELELKQLAQVGLVGAPNVGKSTLLRSITDARPAVADYAFTTLRPGIGVLRFTDGEQIRIADIPGLVEGAAEDRGLGLTFLRHIERTHLLLFIVDLTSPEPWCGLPGLIREMTAYCADLSRRPALLIGNKADLPAAKLHWNRWMRPLVEASQDETIDQSRLTMPLPDELKHLDLRGIMAISALEEKNIGKLARRIRQLVLQNTE